ncbi:hypothetical protein [Marinobacter sp. S0848L]|uniref:hypothetical protein n=1 Tax=Marinobacter sp. S0848L TaxID=2926423 RepID=UPI001FF2D7C9|nr:hypothetical protein [Marinobacter sp. S0848L]MCK0107642.1 hypothetical protein [Marinobacter sp. S0848L]
MKKWQKLELWGMGLVLASVLLQFLIFVSIEQSKRDSDDHVLELRLNSIYHYLRSGKEYNPSWEDIEEHVKGPSVEGDSHWRFDEAHIFFSALAILFFIAGSGIGLWGRYCEHAENNINQ